MRVNPDAGAQFGTMLIQDDEPLADLSQVSLVFSIVVHFLNCNILHTEKCLLPAKTPWKLPYQFFGIMGIQILSHFF